MHAARRGGTSGGRKARTKAGTKRADGSDTSGREEAGGGGGHRTSRWGYGRAVASAGGEKLGERAQLLLFGDYIALLMYFLET